METKYFRSKYNTLNSDLWIKTIKSLGVNVYDVIVPCELAVILGGEFENPSAFTDTKTIVFYRKERERDNSQLWKNQREFWLIYVNDRTDLWVSILSNYFENMVDLTGLTPNKAADKIRSTVETYQ